MLKLEIVTGSAARSATGSSTGSAARSSTRSATGSSTGSVTGCSAGSLTGSVTGNSTGSATGSTSRIRLHRGKELVLCVDGHLAEKKSCALTWYPIYIPETRMANILLASIKCLYP